eukprot:gene9820-11532_t
MSNNNVGSINLIVGGMYYSLLLSDVEAHPNCYFARAIKDVWNNSNDPIVINRDGVLFQHIYGYMYNCRNDIPFVVKGSLSLLVSVRREADYYNFTGLVALYDKASTQALQVWSRAQPLTEWCKPYKVSSPTESATELDQLVLTEVYPACQAGTLEVTPWNEGIYQALDLVKIKAGWCEVTRTSNGTNNMFEVDTYDMNQRILGSLRSSLPTLPGVKSVVLDGNVFAIDAQGYARSNPIGAHCTNRMGTIVYILNSTYTGGVITVSRNGVSKSISKPGEYLMYSSDYARDISTVTSGTLVFAKFSIVRKDQGDGSSFCMLYTSKLVPYDTLPSKNALVQAVHKELYNTDGGNSVSTNGVVICLFKLYSIVEFDPSGPYLETDPDVLTDRDAVLYEYLKDSFAVTLVTVCVQRNGGESKGCILGPALPTTSATPTTKIIAPFHNFQESFM